MANRLKNLITNIRYARRLKRWTRLAEMNIQPYPREDELRHIPLEDGWIDALPLSRRDINDDFTNIDDLNWLKPVALDTSVFMFGETHYLEYISNLRHRVFFTLNTFDHYPFVILEDQYAKTPFVNYFIEMEDDDEATTYFARTLNDFITSEQELAFLKHIRRWNKLHPEKPVKIGYSDLEFNYWATLTKILIPYFQKLDRSIDFMTRSEFSLKYFEKLRSLWDDARKSGLVGDFPFITTDYIKNVILNLESLYHAQRFDFNFYRQKAIIRNLTDRQFFGDCFAGGKVMLCTGAKHAPSNVRYPYEGGFLCEGSYLSHDYEPTRGKTFSMAVLGYAYGLGEMESINPDTCLYQGAEYKLLVKKLQHALERKLISSDDFYVVHDRDGDFEKLFIKKALEFDHRPLLIEHIQWDKLLNAFQSAARMILMRKDYYAGFDKVMFVPRSPLMTARKKTP